jgi:hypothetical protein
MLPFHEREINRDAAVRWILAHKAQMKADRYFTAVTQSEIRALTAFEEFLEKQSPSASVNLNPLFVQALFQENEKGRRLQTRVVRLRRFVRPFVPSRFRPGLADREAILRMPDQRSGRMIERFRRSINEMTAADVDLVASALVEDQRDVALARKVLFNLSWEVFLFPFGEVPPMSMPDIFDLTPGVFNPPFLPGEVLETPFAMLNATDWPFRSASLALFDFLIETDPFTLAETFWEWFNRVALVGHALGVAAGEEVELGFDVMFPYFLIAIFAFGIAEILEVFAFCGAFLEWETESRRQFAMTNCLGIVAYVQKMNPDALRAKMRANKE